MSERQAAARAVRWRTLDEFCSQGLGLLFGILLARLLTPDDFGSYAMLIVFVQLAGVLSTAGFGKALIQRQNITQVDTSTVFWFNQATALSFVAVLVLGAPWIAALFDREELIGLIRIMAIQVWTASLITVPGALLSKRLNFKVQMVAHVAGVLVGGVLGVYLARSGAGATAIAAQLVAMSATRAVIIWSGSGWLPSFVFSGTSFRTLFNFGGYIVLTALLGVLTARFYAILIGRNFGAADLGIFHRAMHTGNIPVRMVSDTFSRIAFPMFSSVSDDPSRLRSRMRTGLLAVMGINLPVMGGLLMTADIAVPLIFGEQWIPSIPYLKVFCLTFMLWPMQLANTLAMQSMGRSRLVMWLEVLKNTLFLLAIIVASRFSMMAIALAMLGMQFVQLVINTWYPGKWLGYGMWAQLRDGLPYWLLTAVMMGLVHLLNGQLEGWDPTLRLLLLASTGASFYFVAGMLFRVEAMSLVKDLVRFGARENLAAPAGDPAANNEETPRL